MACQHTRRLEQLVLGLSRQQVSQFILWDEDVISCGQSVFPGSVFSLKDNMGMLGVLKRQVPSYLMIQMSRGGCGRSTWSKACHHMSWNWAEVWIK